MAKTRKGKKIVPVKPHKRKKKGGRRKCVEVSGYIRKKPEQS